MPKRLPQPTLQTDPTGEYRLMQDYAVAALGYRVTVKTGYLTDSESSPRLAWSVFGHPLDPENTPQAVPHDALYQSQLLSRKVADMIWLDVARQNGMGPFERRVKYRCLRMFGWMAWNKAKANATGRKFACDHISISIDNGTD